MRGETQEVQRLIGDSGVPWDAEDRLGVTAGEYAIYFEHEDIVSILIEKGT